MKSMSEVEVVSGEDIVTQIDVKKRKKRARAAVETAITVALITIAGAIVVALIDYAASTYGHRHPDIQTVSSGKTGILTFKQSSGKSSVTFDITPDSGKLYVSARQTAGPDDTKYKVYYKKTSSKSYGSAKKTFKLDTDNTFSGSQKLGKVKKKTNKI